MAKPTQTINFLGINQPDKEVHSERPQTQHSAKDTWHQIRPQYQIRDKAEGTAARHLRISKFNKQAG